MDFEAQARQITGGPAVELILDAIGGDSLKKDYRLLAPTGQLGMFGVSSAPPTRRGCLACYPRSRARPGFSSIPCL
jgi:NADPH:quinone reductase-like Zn-dependent oxidoreductase